MTPDPSPDCRGTRCWRGSWNCLPKKRNRSSSSPGNCVGTTDAFFSTRTVTTAGATASTTGAYDVVVSDPLRCGASDVRTTDCAADTTAPGDCANPML